MRSIVHIPTILYPINTVHEQSLFGVRVTWIVFPKPHKMIFVHPFEFEVFSTLKQYFKLIGILEFQSDNVYYQNIPTASLQRIVILILAIFSAQTTIWFFLYEAKNQNEIAESFHFASGYFLTIIIYLLLLWNRAKIQYFFDAIQNNIQTRKFLVSRRNIIFIFSHKKNYMKIF